ncbi:MAG TPA: histidinol dehydrogenase [Candidatus Protoclostridium stercorigallinarum]|uniref:Histidinol dehydrogenase n=1 Tax=Candidatus Protoclostridium stercorigallinarum TaxID=2838741 RepID=A0A9D1TRQ1_9FIRM|nr:histidinol dehydrogenase [Candidatus Protoclostridium stercorigallinarum]
MLITNRADGLRRIYSRKKTLAEGAKKSVEEIISLVREKGDEALFSLAEKFDRVKLDKSSIRLGEKEIAAAYDKVSPELLAALRRAKANIEEYHKKQLLPGALDETRPGARTGYMIRPVSRAGIYVPGGKASYPSSVLMTAIPARVAGVRDVIMCTPGTSPLTIVAAVECGVSAIYRIGGAQAVAAMAYGTESVPKADVICGPGNMYVTEAKRLVYGDAGIDMIAGPSEILIIADDSADPEFLAADLLSQAEHDEMAMAILVTTEAELAKKTSDAVERRVKELPKAAIAGRSINDFGTIIVAESPEECVSISDEVAPEHLELCVKDPKALLPLIRNAGAVFMGHWSPEPLGDYYAGTNHVLPNGGTARYFSALGVSNFVKRISLIEYDKDALLGCADDIIALAEAEGLTAHANSIRVRKENGK